MINIVDDQPHNSKQIWSEKTMTQQQKSNDLIGEDNVQPGLSLNNEEC